MKFRITRTVNFTALAISALATVSCGNLWEDAASAPAHNEIMLVRREPPSFGFARLTTHEGHYPDLKVFISQKGLPDFLAETGNQQRHYFILYYLGKRQAFACRSKLEAKGQMEFAGPYPVTEREYRLLDDFRHDRSRVPPAL